MSRDWLTVTLGDHVDLLTGFPFKSSHFTGDPSDIRLAKGVNVGQGRLRWDRVDYWPMDERATYEKFELEVGDVVLAMDRPWVEAGLKQAVVTARDLPALLLQRVARLRGVDGLRTDFLRHVIGSKVFSDYIEPIVTGVNVPHISADQIRGFRLALPPEPVQCKIAAVLSAYDELIENNLRRIEILEEMAQAIYREWFVNFRYPGHEVDKLNDSPLGPIPKGWEVSNLGEESSVVMGQSPKSEYYNDDGVGLPFHQGVTYFGTLFPEHVKYCTVESRIAEAGDALVSVRAPVGRINAADTRMVIGRGLAAVCPLDDYRGFHYRQLRHVFRDEDSMGGGTIYKAITKGDLLGVQWLVPPLEVKGAFDSLERPLFSLTSSLSRQNANLRATRDLLLPELVSGEIDVSDLDIDTSWMAA